MVFYFLVYFISIIILTYLSKYLYSIPFLFINLVSRLTMLLFLIKKKMDLLIRSYFPISYLTTSWFHIYDFHSCTFVFVVVVEIGSDFIFLIISCFYLCLRLNIFSVL